MARRPLVKNDAGPDQHCRICRVRSAQRPPTIVAPDLLEVIQERSEVQGHRFAKAGDFTSPAASRSWKPSFKTRTASRSTWSTPITTTWRSVQIQAMEEAGIKPGKDVTVVSFDATKRRLRSDGRRQDQCGRGMQSVAWAPSFMTAVKEVEGGQIFA